MAKLTEFFDAGEYKKIIQLILHRTSTIKKIYVHVIHRLAINMLALGFWTVLKTSTSSLTLTIKNWAWIDVHYGKFVVWQPLLCWVSLNKVCIFVFTMKETSNVRYYNRKFNSCCWNQQSWTEIPFSTNITFWALNLYCFKMYKYAIFCTVLTGKGNCFAYVSYQRLVRYRTTCTLCVENLLKAKTCTCTYLDDGKD